MEEIFTFSPLVLAVIPVVVGLVSVAKESGMASKFAPSLSLLLGVGLVFVTGAAWQAAVVQGIVAGLAAAGLWSGSKTTVEAIRN